MGKFSRARLFFCSVYFFLLFHFLLTAKVNRYIKFLGFCRNPHACLLHGAVCQAVLLRSGTHPFLINLHHIAALLGNGFGCRAEGFALCQNPTEGCRAVRPESNQAAPLPWLLLWYTARCSGNPLSGQSSFPAKAHHRFSPHNPEEHAPRNWHCIQYRCALSC